MTNVNNPSIEELKIDTWYYGTIVGGTYDEELSIFSMLIELDVVDCILSKNILIDTVGPHTEFIDIAKELNAISEDGRLYFDRFLFKDVAVYLTESSNGKIFVDSVKKDDRTKIEKYKIMEVKKPIEEKGGETNEI